MPSNGYNTALWIFYIPFVLVEIPSNMLMSLPHIRPNLFLGCNMLILGIVSMCQGLTKSYGGILACRFLMGIFEATLPAGSRLIGTRDTNTDIYRCRPTRSRILHSQAGLSSIRHVLHLRRPGSLHQRSPRLWHQKHERHPRERRVRTNLSPLCPGRIVVLTLLDILDRSPKDFDQEYPLP